MMGKEPYFTACRRCGRKILMMFCEEAWMWVACDPELKRFSPGGGPETYVTPEGKVNRGYRAFDGDYGYRKHRKDCDRP